MGVIDETRIEKARDLMDQVLQLLREDRDIRAVSKVPGGRELSEAITCFEDGSMWMIRSLYADVPYTPKLKLTAAAENTAQVSEQMKRSPAERLPKDPQTTVEPAKSEAPAA